MNKKTFLLLLIVLLKLVFQFVLISPDYDLHRDEYLHLDQAHHLAWGYLSVPPVTGCISYIILLLGNAVFWVKFFPALFGALTIVFVWKIIEELNGGLFALLLGAIAVLFSVIARINILYQPNSLEILLWTTTYFCVVKYIRSENIKWLYWLAVSFAIGFLNKYNIAFLMIGLLPAALFTRHRTLLKNKHLYFAAILALLIVSPNLYWQYENNFPVVHHMNELMRTQLVNVNRADFIKEQVLFFLGSIFVLVAAFISFFVYKPFAHYRVFFWSFFITISAFIYYKAKGYYAIGLYPLLLAFGSVYLEYFLRKGWKLYLRPLAIVIPILLFIPFFKLVFPVYSPAVMQQKLQSYKELGLLRWEDGKDHQLPQDFADMQGWKEMARKTDSAYAILSATGNTLVLCDNYGEAGAINYYSRFKNIQAVSFNADYINWFPLDKKISHIVLVQEITDTDPGREKEKPLFEKITLSGKVTNPYAREYGTSIYMLQNAKADINALLKKELEETKNHKD